MDCKTQKHQLESSMPDEIAELVVQAKAAGATEVHTVRGCHKSLLFFVDPGTQTRHCFPLYDEVFLKHTSPVRLLLLVFPEEVMESR